MRLKIFFFLISMGMNASSDAFGSNISMPKLRSRSDSSPITSTLLIVKASNNVNDTPTYGLYEVQEEQITRRGQLEATLMSGKQTPLAANKQEIKGVGYGGGFGMNDSKKKANMTALKALAKGHSKVLREEGVVRIDSVLSESTADELHSFVFSSLKTAQSEVDAGKVKRIQRFADVLLRKNRSDLTMPLGRDIIYRGLYEALCKSAIGQTMEVLLGTEAMLYEFSCLISFPGSDRQVVHPDTPCTSDHGDQAVLYTCFIALQDIRMDMGPTIWLPKTHTKHMHELFKDDLIRRDSDESPKDKLLREQPAVLGLLPKGSCAIFDSRILHCGTANQSLNDPRALFYFSFKHPKVGYPGNPASIRPDLAGKLTLSTMLKDLEFYSKGKGCVHMDAIAANMV